MILAAGLLVLVGLGLFVGGILTGMTAFYWGCVAVCVVAAVLLFLARRKLTTASVTAASTGDRHSAPPAHAAGAPLPADSRPPAAEDAITATEQPAAASAAGATAVSAAMPAHRVEEHPPVEEVEVTDLLLVVDLKDEVLVVDEHPRYHLPGCRHVGGRTTIPIPLDEARTDGFTPCAVCAPDRNLAQRERERRRRTRGTDA